MNKAWDARNPAAVKEKKKPQDVRGENWINNCVWPRRRGEVQCEKRSSRVWCQGLVAAELEANIVEEMLAVTSRKKLQIDRGAREGGD